MPEGQQDDYSGYMLPTFCMTQEMDELSTQKPVSRTQTRSDQSQDDFVMRPESKLIHN